MKHTIKTMNNNLKIKKVEPDATVPTLGSKFAAGYDLYAYIKEDDGFCYIEPGCTALIKTGVVAEIPVGFFGGIYARSGIATKRGLRPANCTGVVDADYRGEIMVALHNDSTELQPIAHGERIAQLVIQPYLSLDIEVVSELDDTERGDGGFGSSDNKKQIEVQKDECEQLSMNLF